MAEIVGGDLYHLWRVSDVHLPRIADAFYDANRLLAGAQSGGSDRDAFRDNAPVYPGASFMTSTIGAAWAELRDELQSLYAQNGEIILGAADGLRRAMDIFVTADLCNADALSQYLADPANHDPNDPASNPPRPGSEDDPGEPVLPD